MGPIFICQSVYTSLCESILLYIALIYYCRLGAKAKKTDNRIMLGLSLICALFGSLLCGDWQAIGNKPCSYTNTSNITDYNDCTASFTCTNNSTNLSMFVRSCEAMSSSSDECFWNPKSRITGEFCNSCVSVCLSKEKSIDIYQFGLGVVFISLSASLGYTFLSAVMSDITPVDTQVSYHHIHSVCRLLLIIGSHVECPACNWYIF